MSLDIKYIKDNEGNNFFPLVHEKGVVDDNGTTLESKLQSKQDEITTVTVNVDNNTGTPSGSANMSGGTLSLNFSNIKGEKGDTGAQGIQGPQGERGLPGESGVTGDVSGFTVIQTIDPSATYGATDIAGAATVQATNQELTELAGEVDDSLRIIADLKEVTGLTESSYNMFGSAIPTHLFPANGNFSLYTTAQSYIIPVEPNKTVTVDGKTSGNRFQIVSSETMPEAGASYEKTTSSSTATKLSLILGSNDKYILLYVDNAGNADVSNIRVYYGTDFISSPSTTLASKAELSLLTGKVDGGFYY